MTQHSIVEEGVPSVSSSSASLGAKPGKLMPSNESDSNHSELPGTTEPAQITCPEVILPPPTKRFPPGRNTNQLQVMRNAVRTLFRLDAAAPFRQPVDPIKLRIPTYYVFVRNPMDLGTIRARLNNFYYNSLQECLLDFQYMFCNCYYYNAPDSSVVEQGRYFELSVIGKLSDMPPEEEEVPKEATPRRSSTASRQSEDGNVTTLTPGTDATDSPSTSQPRHSLRLRQVMTKPPVKYVLAPTAKIMKSVSTSSEEDSTEVEQSADEGEGRSEDDTVPKEEKPTKKSAGVKTTLGMDLILREKIKERRMRQMKLIQQQMNNLNRQMKALQQEEKEDALLFKRLNAAPSSSAKGSSAATPAKKKEKIPAAPATTAGRGRPRNIASNSISPPKPLPSKRKISEGSTSNDSTTPGSSSGFPRANKQRKPDITPTTPSAAAEIAPSPAAPAPTAPAPTASKKSYFPLFSTMDRTKSLNPAQLETLSAAVNLLSEDVFHEVIQIASYHSTAGDDDEDNDLELNLGVLPAYVQWEIVDVVENARIQNVAQSAPVSSPRREAPLVCEVAPAARETPAENLECESLTFHADTSAAAVLPLTTSRPFTPSQLSESPDEADAASNVSTPSENVATNDAPVNHPQPQPATPEEEFQLEVDESIIFLEESDADDNEDDDPTLDMY